MHYLLIMLLFLTSCTPIQEERFNKEIITIREDLCNIPKIKPFEEPIEEVEEILECTEDEITLMLRVIETETCGGDLESKTHIGFVILNRVKNEKFPDNISAVITAPNQFAYWRTGISESTYEALDYVLSHPDTTYGAVYFNSNEPRDSWYGAKRVLTDNVGHSFYSYEEGDYE